jgi:indole-3-glycerol phosphate synthase
VDRIEASRRDADRLKGQPLSEVTPSRRDFSTYVAGRKDEPEIIARVTFGDDRSTRERLAAYASACDDAGVAALSVSLLDGLTAQDLLEISTASTAPVLREDPLIEANQIYHSRLHGIDAVVLPADAMPANDIERLVDIAVSTHMSVVIECNSEAAVGIALRWPYALLGMRDLEAARELGRLAPANRAMILLSEVDTAEAYDSVRGICDAVLVGPSLMQSLRLNR